MNIDKSKDQMFWDKTKLNPETGCIEWIGFKKSNGYGQVKRFGGPFYVHRWVWILYKGLIPEGKMVLHSCDNRCCVNLEHLSLGTATDNVRDMIAKGRENVTCSWKVGNRPHNVLLNEEKVKEIRALYPLISSITLSRIFKLSSKETIIAVTSKRNWKYVPDPSPEEIKTIRAKYLTETNTLKI